MASRHNHLGQPIGEPLPEWRPPPFPPREPLEGRFCRVEPLTLEAHFDSLYVANARARDDRNWTYLPYGPFPDREGYRVWMEGACSSTDPLFHAIVDARTRKAVGVAAYSRITPPVGVIEVGHLVFSPLLQRTPAATEAMFLMAERAFAVGYRRYEWKCDALNAPSRAAALRLGFSFEGLFPQATLYK
ncbi:MAG TPA: GNAT family protein, partial [Armatimonadota bacterium]|nr:GNAT family protein [Armatimonadota bacterium]